VSRRATHIAAVALTLVGVEQAAGHGGGSHSGFVATVSYIEPPQVGLLVRVTGGHEALEVRNLTRKTVAILGENEQPRLRLAPGQSGSVADPRIGSTGPPPSQGEFVKDWRIPGTAGDERFEIVGFLGYRAPAGEEGDDRWPPVWAVALVGGVLVAALLALPLLALRKGERVSESSGTTGSE
jgi:hypothetical protein